MGFVRPEAVVSINLAVRPDLKCPPEASVPGPLECPRAIPIHFAGAASYI
jgi:hypothetical protein